MILWLAASLGGLEFVAVSADAQPGLLASDPSWSTSTSAETFALAVGDFDADGRLDLVQGNYGVPSRLYLDRGPLDQTPVWISTRADSVTCAAVGDVDGDGLTDLILATARGDAALYLNQRGPAFLPDTPSRLLRLGGATDIALADLDRDGDADLIATRAGGMTNVYLAEAGGLAADPIWSATEGADRIALGDVDGNGALDLVTVRHERVSLHRGRKPFFEATPSWSAPDSGLTSLALGDLDGDGDYDLVTGARSPGTTRIYENLGAGFAGSAAWSIAGEDSTNAVVLGDADADGDLDLACGNLDRSRVYRHAGGLTGWTPAWQAPGAATTAIAWADFDADGQLDLVQARLRTEVFRNLTGFFATAPEPAGIPGLPLAIHDVDGDGRPDLISITSFGGSAELHRGNGNGFEPSAAWTSPSAEVHDAALGDVDGDGDVDLVAVGDGATLYTWDAGGFATAPAWTAPIGSTSSLALGDVDGDGDVDLVTGSSVSRPSLRLFLNRGFGFRTVEDWSDSLAAVESIALGDVDDDRDLDLVVGSPALGARLFQFAAQIFKPRWSSNSNDRTHGVALEDIDGDGFRDLVLANDGFSALYANGVGKDVFPATPTWNLTTPSIAADVAIGDPDADGDLDVVFTGVSGDPMLAVPNAAGILELVPQILPTGSQRVLLHDVDADGDLDLVADQPTGMVIHRGRREPAFRGDPENPVHRLPNNPPVIRDLRVTESGANARVIDFTVQDAEADSLWILAEFGFRGSRQWNAVDSPQGRGKVGPLPASPSGISHRIDWDLGRFPADSRPVELRLRAVPYHQRLGPTQRATAAVLDLAPIAVQRPQLDAAPQSIELDVITVGDTTSTLLYLRNLGNLPLHIEGFELVNIDDVRLNPQAPLDLNPGQRVEVLLYFEPRVPVGGGPGPGVERYLAIRSDDPANPRELIELIATARPLAGRAQALVPTLPAPLGEPIVVQLLPEPFVHVEKATLYYAAVGSDHFIAVPMALLGFAYIASIPAVDVTEVGVRFYVELENSQVRTTDPANAPLEVHEIPVAAPTAIEVVPQPTSRGEFAVGRDINVQVGLQPGTAFVDGTLYYRSGGAPTFEQEPILINFLLGVLQGTIPGSAVGPRGIEYWVEVSTLTERLRYPPAAGRDPASIRTLVASLAESTTQPGMRYRIVSVPVDFGADTSRPLDALLSDQSEFGPYDPVRWRAFRFLGAAGTVERAGDDSNFAVVPGRAFWLVSRVDHRVDTTPLEGLSVSTDSAFPIPLEPGWNQIGHPFAFPVAWTSIRPPPGIEPPVAFDPRLGTAGDYAEEPASVLEPFHGYFLWNGSATAETLFVPPVAAPVDSPAVAAVAEAAATNRTAAGGVPDPKTDSWAVVVAARTSRAAGGSRRAIVCPGARLGRDDLDAHDPPPPPGDWVGAGFVAADEPGGNTFAARDGPHPLLRRDARPADPAGHRWEIELGSSRPGEAITVDLRLDGEPPPAFELQLLDPLSRQRIPLERTGARREWRDALELVSRGPAKPARLLLLAGTPAYLAQEGDAVATVPARLVLEQNEPNPFNGTTRMRFGLATPGRARVELFDIRGRRIAVLFDRDVPAGWHSVLWDGRDATGREVASGVYVVRLVTAGTTLARRVAFLK